MDFNTNSTIIYFGRFMSRMNISMFCRHKNSAKPGRVASKVHNDNLLAEGPSRAVASSNNESYIDLFDAFVYWLS